MPEAPLPTEGPSAELVQRQLLKRDGATWGYISGDSGNIASLFLMQPKLRSTGSPLTCAPGYSVLYDGISNNFVACCNDVVCINDWHTCIPNLGTGCADTDACSEIYTAFTSWYGAPQSTRGDVTSWVDLT